MPPPKFLIIGAGSRGTAYAEAVTTSTPGTIHAVAEPHPFKRQQLGKQFIWGDAQPGAGQEFTDWRGWVEYETSRRERVSRGEQNVGEEGVDGVFVCTLDETHVEILLGIAHLGVHVLCEKPLGVDLGGCLDVWRAYSSDSSSTSTSTSTLTSSDTSPPSKKNKKEKDGSKARQKQIFSIGHVLRYSPHNLLLRKLLLEDNVIGDVVSLEHVEPVGWWHFAHSYVRGNWRRETGDGVGSLLTKSCHDVDFVMWLLAYSSHSGIQGEEGEEEEEDIHYPSTITSTGHLSQFTHRRKPPKAGTHTNCVTCPVERECLYSAVKIYRDMHLRAGKTEWPVNIVCPDIEDFTLSSSHSPEDKDQAMAKAENRLMQALQEDYDAATTPDEIIASRPWYGRCVYEADNNVCDDQVVTISWDDESPLPSSSFLSSSSLSSSCPSSSTPSSSTPQKGRRRKGSKTATIHMIAPTEAQCVRRGRIYGTAGELAYDSSTISYFDFASQKKVSIAVPRQSEAEEKAHGGGDYGLARGFVGAVDAVVNKGVGVEAAQRRFVGCSLREIIVSHGVVFAAEGARRENRVVGWEGWWGDNRLAS
ncbi:hypothetical protein BDW42DRAFT_195764 [Aspergillus taichungensis]|uniref:NAD(P)-binding protein n=1 Tax=Aspergillus taichungensis TaxID=482145 RepID=A0A2J5HN71_9EURO|nr:hypothetical protein BDW42DRAFT_195764 [Aspergillus taichungensis]